MTDKSFRKLVLQSRKHECAVCKKQSVLGSGLDVAHIACKSTYPMFRYRLKNAELLCRDCHREIDHDTHRARANKAFAFFFNKQEQLIRQYHRIKSNRLLELKIEMKWM